MQKLIDKVRSSEIAMMYVVAVALAVFIMLYLGMLVVAMPNPPAYCTDYTEVGSTTVCTDFITATPRPYQPSGISW